MSLALLSRMGGTIKNMCKWSTGIPNLLNRIYWTGLQDTLLKDANLSALYPVCWITGRGRREINSFGNILLVYPISASLGFLCYLGPYKSKCYTECLFLLEVANRQLEGPRWSTDVFYLTHTVLAHTVFILYSWLELGDFTSYVNGWLFLKKI